MLRDVRTSEETPIGFPSLLWDVLITKEISVGLHSMLRDVCTQGKHL
jgi:hypothetical protein